MTVFEMMLEDHTDAVARLEDEVIRLQHETKVWREIAQLAMRWLWATHQAFDRHQFDRPLFDAGAPVEFPVPHE